MYKANIPSAP